MAVAPYRVTAIISLSGELLDEGVFRRFLFQIRLNEPIDFAVHDTCDVARLVTRAMILHHRVRLHYIAAYLAAPLSWS